MIYVFNLCSARRAYALRPSKLVWSHLVFAPSALHFLTLGITQPPLQKVLVVPVWTSPRLSCCRWSKSCSIESVALRASSATSQHVAACGGAVSRLEVRSKRIASAPPIATLSRRASTQNERNHAHWPDHVLSHADYCRPNACSCRRRCILAKASDEHFALRLAPCEPRSSHRSDARLAGVGPATARSTWRLTCAKV